MLDRATLVSLLVTIVPCVIAVLIARRWPVKSAGSKPNDAARLSVALNPPAPANKAVLFSAFLLSIGWLTALVVGFYLRYERLPPVPWSTASLNEEPWESLAWPLLIIGIAWPLWLATFSRKSLIDGAIPNDQSARWQIRWLTVLAMGFAVVVLHASLVRAERYQALISGNYVWFAATLASIAINCYLFLRLAITAPRWSTWVLVAQLLTAAALVMTCYGSWGQWCWQAGLCLAVVALSCLLVGQSAGPLCIALPALIASGVILMHIRDYSSIALPAWLAPLPMLMPGLVCMSDRVAEARLSGSMRCLLAAILSFLFSATTVGLVVALGGSGEDW